MAHKVVHTVGGYEVIYSETLLTYFVKHNGKHLLAPRRPCVQQTALQFFHKTEATAYADKLANN